MELFTRSLTRLTSYVSTSSGVLIGDSVLMKHSSELKESMSIDAGIDFAGVMQALFQPADRTRHRTPKSMQSEKTIATNKAVVNIAQATFRTSRVHWKQFHVEVHEGSNQQACLEGLTATAVAST